MKSSTSNVPTMDNILKQLSLQMEDFQPKKSEPKAVPVISKQPKHHIKVKSEEK